MTVFVIHMMGACNSLTISGSDC